MKTLGNLSFAWLLVALVCWLPNRAVAQNPLKMEQFSPKEMEMMWARFEKDAGWSAIVKDVAGKKFQRVKHEKASWGFKGTLMRNGKEVDVLFCAFDFYNPASKAGQGCSMIWRKVGDEVYKAYLIFPDGEKDFDKALEGSVEWFADEKGGIQKANSWGKCFRKCVKGSNKVVVDIKGNKFSVPDGCSSGCLASIAVCGGATAILAAVTGGVTFPAAAIMFGVCAGVSCGTCIGICALGCM